MDLFDRPSIELTCYTAGLFDGEGSIWVQRQGNRYLCGLSQGEVNDGRTLCEWLRASWGIGTVNCQRKQWRGKEWAQWHWSINAAQEIRFFLSSLLPYLHVKRDSAIRALAAIPPDLRAKWAVGEDRFVIASWGSLSEEQIGKALGRSEPSVRHRARRLGLPDKRNSDFRVG